MPEVQVASSRTGAAEGEDSRSNDPVGQLGARLKDRGNPGFAAAALGASVAGPTLGGYSLIRAASLDAAVALARGCPLLPQGGAVEICALANHDDRFELRDSHRDTDGSQRSDAAKNYDAPGLEAGFGPASEQVYLLLQSCAVARPRA